MRVLLQTEHVRLEHDPLNRIIRFQRTSKPFATVAEAVATFQALYAARGDLDVSKHSLLSDVREGPGRSDEAFERATEALRSQTLSGFAKSAVLVRTAAGRLQILRLWSESGRSKGPEVFTDEDEAMRYLAGPTAAHRAPR